MRRVLVKLLFLTLLAPTLWTGGNLSAASSSVTSQQNEKKHVSGIVSDKSGAPVPGASVMIPNSTIGTVTGPDGRFSFDVPAGTKTLEASSLGYTSVTITLGAGNIYNIILEEDSEALEEVVVVGYGTQKKVNLTGSVSSVNYENESMSSRAITDASNALSGLAPGLSVFQSSGQPGGDGSSLLIRGTGTLNSGSSPLVIIDGQPGSLGTLNPNDISNISILKDAASSAIYGSRAANGVILVTTKSGNNSDGKVSFSYTGNISMSRPAKLYDVIDQTADHMAVVNMIQRNSNAQEYFTQAQMDEWRSKSATDPIRYPNTNPWDAVLQYNPVHNHTISARGGSKNISLYSSLSYLDNGGLMPNTAFKRYTFRNNLSYKINDWLTLGSNISAFLGNQQPGYGGPDTLNYLITTSPSLLPKHPDGRYGAGMLATEAAANNILRGLETARGERRTNRYIGKVFVKLTPIEGLEINGSYFINQYHYNAHGYSVPSALWNFQTETMVQSPANSISLSNSNNRSRQEIIDVFANYSKSFGDHNFNFLAGFNQEYYLSENLGTTKGDLLSIYTPVNNAAATLLGITGTASDYAMRSFFGRINYDYKGKYLFEANLRADGSSRFSKENRWGYFPSFSAGWRVSEEPFWAGLKKGIDYLKLRASWGQLGNNNVGNYAWQETYAIYNSSYNGTVVSGIGSSAIANDQMTWETTDVLNLGLDATIAKHVTLTLDYYNKLSHGILAQLPIPYVNGGLTAPTINSAQVRNTGLELDVAYENNIGDLQFRIGANGAFNKNEIVKYKGDLLESHGYGVWTEGQPIGKYYLREVDHIVKSQSEIDNLVAQGYKFSGTKPGPGDLLYKDADGDMTIGSDNDRVLMGNPHPKFIYGANLTLAYKGFDFYALLSGVAGYDKYLSSTFFSHKTYTTGYMYPKYFMDMWSESNPDSTVPKAYTSDTRNSVNSEYYLHKADFLRVKTLQLGYTLPKSLMDKIGLQTVRIYANLENFFTFTSYPGLDPEASEPSNASGATYPIMKTASVGLNINF
ncbi:MAG: TonB-dependent receptor [Bacteroidales bacterium]|nr:TonB-dependent receptor [Bacteroidales bacterium]